MRVCSVVGPVVIGAVAWLLLIAAGGPFSSPLCTATGGKFGCPTFRFGGTTTPAFAEMESVFRTHFAQGFERSSQLSIWKDGEEVVDLWGSDNSEYHGRSLQVVFSSTKVFSAIMMSVLVDRSLLAYSDTVAKHWPEFAANGKGDVTIADVLRHEAGLPFLSSNEPFMINCTMEDVERRLAEAERVTELRSYHAVSRGFLLNAVFRRVEPKGRPMGQFAREEILPSLDLIGKFALGARNLEDNASPAFILTQGPPVHGVLTMILPYFLGLTSAEVTHSLNNFLNPESFLVKSGFFEDVVLEDPVSMQTDGPLRADAPEMGSLGGLSCAHALAKIGQVIALGGELDGFRMLNSSTVSSLVGEGAVGFDQGFLFETVFTEGGVADFGRTFKTRPALKGWFGWTGFGGSFFMFHPEKRLSLGFAMTGMMGDVVDRRVMAFLEQLARLT